MKTTDPGYCSYCSHTNRKFSMSNISPAYNHYISPIRDELSISNRQPIIFLSQLQPFSAIRIRLQMNEKINLIVGLIPYRKKGHKNITISPTKDTLLIRRIKNFYLAQVQESGPFRRLAERNWSPRDTVVNGAMDMRQKYK